MAISMPMVMIPELSKYKMVATEVKDPLHQEIKTLMNDSLDYALKSKLLDLTKYYKDESHLLTIEEDSTDIKEINGYKCHKVYLNYVEDMEALDLSFTISSVYVTDKIRMNYHPVIKFKSVLEKYYPLEITNTLQLMRGFKITYTLKELKTSL